MKLYFLIFSLLLTSMVSAQNHLSSPSLFTRKNIFSHRFFFGQNPALLSTPPSPELGFFYDKYTDNDNLVKIESESYSFSAAFPHFAFSYLNRKDPVNKKRQDFYSLSFSLGNPEFSIGFSKEWVQGGNISIFPAVNSWKGGILYRPSPYISLTGSTVLKSEEIKWLTEERRLSYWDAGLGLRPFKNDRVTLFSQYGETAFSGHTVKNLNAGIKLRLFPGRYLTLYRYESEPAGFGPSFSKTSLWGLSLEVELGESAFSIHRTAAAYPSHTSFDYYHGTRRKGFCFLQKPIMVKIRLKGKIGYEKSFFRKSLNHYDYLDLIARCADDPQVGGFLIHLEEPAAPFSFLYELKKELRKARKKGKRVYYYLARGGIKELYLISNSDKTYFDPMGSFFTPGLIFHQTYLKGLLEKLGIGFEQWRYFKYKSALDSFTETELSQADKEQKKALLDDTYRILSDDYMKDKGFKENFLKLLFDDETIIRSEKAKLLGIIDSITPTPPKFEGFKEINIDKYEPIRTDTWGNKPEIAIVYAIGVCHAHYGIKAEKLHQLLKKLENDPNVKAVVLRVDSPGGDALASDWVTRAVDDFKKTKPLIISQGSMAASGGYWISMNGTRIYSTPFTITGSIGVIGGWLYNKGFKEKIGLSADWVSIGKHADLMGGISFPLLGVLPDRNLNEEEKGKIKNHITSDYDLFVSKVATYREIKKSEVHDIAQGRVWSGFRAKGIGLADEWGSLQDAVEDAARHSGYSLDEIQTKQYMYPSLDILQYMGVKAKTRSLTEQLLKLRVQFNGKPLTLYPGHYVVY